MSERNSLFQSIKRLVMLSVPHQLCRRIVAKPGFRTWEKKGRPIPPPPLAKQLTVQEYARRLSLRILVETGTYLGDMIAASLRSGLFDRIYSVELDPMLANHARRRFARFDHVRIYQGDSNQILPSILARVYEPCLFWLDAHYSGGITARGELESPIMQELHVILNHPCSEEHVILIDDACAFVGTGGYPALAELKALMLQRHPDWVFYIKDNVIRMHGQLSEHS